MGTPEFAATCLQGLLKSDFIDVVGVVTQPDRARGRGQKIIFNEVKKLAVDYDLPVYRPVKPFGFCIIYA